MQPSVEITDVGVAGLWRLLERIEEIRRMPVVIAVAGMDAALPTVIGGLVPGVIIGVPTSVGYGVAAGGDSALHSMLSSCAPGPRGDEHRQRLRRSLRGAEGAARRTLSTCYVTFTSRLNARLS